MGNRLLDDCLQPRQRSWDGREDPDTISHVKYVRYVLRLSLRVPGITTSRSLRSPSARRKGAYKIVAVCRCGCHQEIPECANEQTSSCVIAESVFKQDAGFVGGRYYVIVH